jgi:hypothetical protein
MFFNFFSLEKIDDQRRYCFNARSVVFSQIVEFVRTVRTVRTVREDSPVSKEKCRVVRVAERKTSRIDDRFGENAHGA